MTITPRHLTDEEFRNCFAAPMQNITETAEAAADIWSYVDGLALDELRLPSINDVQHVYRDATGRFDQILIGTGRFNVLLVVVVDVSAKQIVGHHLLDLNEKFGVSGEHLRPIS